MALCEEGDIDKGSTYEEKFDKKAARDEALGTSKTSVATLRYEESWTQDEGRGDWRLDGSVQNEEKREEKIIVRRERNGDEIPE